MKLVIQRVKNANVKVDSNLINEIDAGLMILVGIHEDDEKSDAEWLATKVSKMRIFSDLEGKMNLSIKDVNGQILAISQFTLYAHTAKGNRPSFVNAAKAEKATVFYDYFCEILNSQEGITCKKGIFGADMQVSLCNDGPVTIVIDSRNKE